jgi:hypothetical protein
MQERSVRSRLHALGVASLLLLTWLAVPPASAQTVSGTVSGSVRDAQGSVVAAATVALVSNRRGTSFPGALNASGDFVVPTVPPDAYTLKVTADGFKPVERSVVVNSNDRLDLGTLVLEVGGITESVTVEAAPAELQRASAERSYAIEGQVVQNIAVNGRSFFGLAFLAPGVVATNAANTQQATPTGDSATLSANGQRRGNNNVQIDGITDMDTGNNGGPMVALSLDSVQEFKILTSNYQAEYGRSVGAQVIAVTKSGGRDFHGSAYLFRRADDLNANTWVNGHTPSRDAQGNQLTYTPTPKLDQRDIGYTLGGPVYVPGKFNSDRSKLFFFFSQEYQHRLNPQTQPQRVRVPTLLERQGDFSQTRDNAGNLFPYIRDYTTGLPCSAADTRGCFQDGGVVGRIPRNRQYDIGVNILRMYPEPNSDSSLNQGFNYVTQEATSQPERQDLLRMDWFPTSSWRISAKALNNKSDRLMPYGSFVLASNLPEYDISYLFPRRGYSFTTAGTLNATTFVEASWGYSHNSIDIVPNVDDPDAFTKTNLGLSGIPTIFPNDVQLDLPPRFQYGGRVANPPVLGTNNAPFQNFNTTKDLSVSVIKILGSHTAKAGVYYHTSLKPQSSFANANGNIIFTNDANNPYDTGFPYANAITGVYQQYNQASGYFIGNYKYRNLEWYLQDNWKASGKLTLDYGVRFYNMTPQYDSDLQTANFIPERYDPAQAPRLYFPGRDASGARVAVDRVTGQTLPAAYIGRIVPNTGTLLNGVFQAGQGIEDELYPGSGLLIAPRFGFTYDPTAKGEFIIRGGGGVFYDRAQGNSVFDLLGNPPTTLSPTFFNGRLQDIDPNNILLAPPSLVAFDRSGKIPTVYAYNLGVQMKLPFDSVLDVSYVGTRGKNQLQGRQLNAPPYGATYLPQNQDPTAAPSTIPGQTALTVDFLRPYQGFGDIRMNELASSSNYHSLQTSLNRRFTRGLLLGINYTWSKALGTVSDDNQNSLTAIDTPRIDGNQRLANYGPMDFDRRHNLIASFVWELPKTGSSGILGGIVNNWQMSGVYRWQTGAPYNVTVSIPGIAGSTLTGTTNTSAARVVLTGDPGSGNSNDPYRQLNAQAFAAPRPGSIGLESGRNFLNRAATNNLDLTLSKFFLMGGERRLELRLDAFNALNHTQFFDVNSTIIFRSLTDLTPTNLPYDAAGNLVNPNGFGTVANVRPPRTIQLMARFQF